MNASRFSAIGAAIADYTGRQVRDLDVVPDPDMPGVFAVRAVTRMHGGKTRATDRAIFFLIRNVPLQKVTADDLEEVEFTTWPPEVVR